MGADGDTVFGGQGEGFANGQRITAVARPMDQLPKLSPRSQLSSMSLL
jgi:hypothetical protein